MNNSAWHSFYIRCLYILACAEVYAPVQEMDYSSKNNIDLKCRHCIICSIGLLYALYILYIAIKLYVFS